MIYSSNSESSLTEFNQLLDSTINHLNSHALDGAKDLGTLAGKALEPYVKELMEELAIGTTFQNTIELISGQKFPDIVANKFYGVEVKTTTQNHWKTTGNSVLESTRVHNVERIFMLFAKLASPIEFKCRPYEDVLSEVVVTHSPRYQIDMNLQEGETIFDKISIPYDELRNRSNPIRAIVDYYKSKLRPGEDLWWMDGDSSGKPSSLIIRIWNNLSLREQRQIRIQCMVFFPELFGNNPRKFNSIAVWLINTESIVCPNIRDIFSAGGQGSFPANGTLYRNVPRIFMHLFASAEQIRETIQSTPPDILSGYWNRETSDATKLEDWLELVTNHSIASASAQHLNVAEIITDLLGD